MDFNKIPRWFLIMIFGGSMSLGGIALKGAWADLDSTKARSLSTEQSVRELSSKFDGVENRLTQFEQKYDRNQEENQKVFREILKAVK